MKIIGIMGSPRGTKGNTAILLNSLLEGAQGAGAGTELILLCEWKVTFCLACERCHGVGSCGIEDDVPMIQRKMAEADGIVLASPNYMNCVTAQMKALMDRSSYMVHTFLLEGKYGASVATAGGGEEAAVAEFQNRFLRNCGVLTVGSAVARAGRPSGLRNQEEAVGEAMKLGEDLVAAIGEKRRFLEQEAAHREFYERMKSVVLAHADVWTSEYEYWRHKGRLP